MSTNVNDSAPSEVQAERADKDLAQGVRYRPGLLDGFLAKAELDFGNPHH